MYKNQHNKEMSTQSIAQLASTVLYGKRFFPYYTFNIIGGLDEEGNIQIQQKLILMFIRKGSCL